MPTVPISFGTGANPGRTGHDGAALLLNCYAESAGKEGKIPFPINAIEGLDLFSTLTDGGAGRGIFRHSESELLVVSGQKLFSVDPLGTATVKGGIPSDGPVTFSQNRASPAQTVIVTDGRKFIYSDGSLSTVTDVDVPPANSTGWMDGYTLYFIDDGRIFNSEIDDAGNVDPLSFVEAEGSPDGIVRGHVRGRTVYVFGSESIELFVPTGDADTPFARRPGAVLQVGCAAAGSVTNFAGGVAFVTEGDHEFDGQVRVVFADGSLRRISHHAVERDIEALADRSTITAYSYSHRGHEFLVVSAATWTWVFDSSIGEWHKRESYQKGRYLGQWHARFQGKSIFTDFEAGKLYAVNPDTQNENGQPILMRLRAPIVHAFPNALQIGAMFFDFAPGTGVATGSGSTEDPQIGFRYSMDGGNTWSSERTLSMGKQGERKTQARTFSLGRTGEDGIIPELTMSADVVRNFTGAAMNARAL